MIVDDRRSVEGGMFCFDFQDLGLSRKVGIDDENG